MSSRRRLVPFRLWAACLLLLATCLGGLASAETGCSAVNTIDASWTSVAPPSSAMDTPDPIVDYAVDPFGGKSLVVATTRSTFVSSDGGCSWSEADVSGLTPATGFRAVSIEWSTDPSDPHRVWMLGSEVIDQPLESGTKEVPRLFVSGDSGRTWTDSSEGLPPAGSPVSVHMTPGRSSDGYVLLAVGGPPVFFRTRDGGASWALATDPTIDPQQVTRVLTDFAISPNKPEEVWTWGSSVLARSTDGARTFAGLPGPTEVTTFDLGTTSSGKLEARAFPSTPGVFRSTDGESWSPEQLPFAATSSESGRPPGSFVFSTGRDAAESLWTFDLAAGKWKAIGPPGVRGLTDIGISLTDDPLLTAVGGSFLYFHRGPLFAIPRVRRDQPRLTNIPGLAATQGCPPSTKATEWQPGWEPVPKGQGPIYVTNFDTGYTVRFDERGGGSVVAVAPRFSEGIALDYLGRVIVTTRFSNALARLDPKTCALEILDTNAYFAEGPTFDAQGNLFIANTDDGIIWEYPFPQVPGHAPTKVGQVGGFLEDVKIAPPGSPYAGNLLALYRDRSHQVDDHRACNEATQPVCRGTQGNPNAIAVFERGVTGWQRRSDFANFSATDGTAFKGKGTFESAGMAFLPDGSLLVTNFCCDGQIRRYAPDGSSWTEFARISPAVVDEKDVYLIKVAATADGYVYVTASTSTSFAQSEDQAFLVRLDPWGRVLTPDFTQNLTVPVGIAVPQVFDLPNLGTPPEEKKEIPTVVRDVRQRMVAAPYAPPEPPLPPPPPLQAPAPAAAVEAPPVPAQAPAPAPAPASNPQGALMTQKQQQPQAAFVFSTQQLQDQVANQYAMTALRQPRDPLALTKLGLVMGALSLMAAWGFVLSIKPARAARVSDRKF